MLTIIFKLRKLSLNFWKSTEDLRLVLWPTWVSTTTHGTNLLLLLFLFFTIWSIACLFDYVAQWFSVTVL